LDYQRFLNKKKLIAIDTVLSISVSEIFERIDSGCCKAVTSALTLLETLVIPLKKNDQSLVKEYEQVLSNSRGITLVDISIPILRKAALLRTEYRLKTPDAIQIATAVEYQCEVFITNDRKLPKIKAIDIVNLADLSN